jgi:serine/threonine protein kinase
MGAYGAVYEATLALLAPASDGTAEGATAAPNRELGIVAVKYQALPDEAMLLNNLAAELALLHALSFGAGGGGCGHLLRFYGAALLSPPPPSLTCVQPFEAGSTCVAMAFEVAREGDLESRVARARRAMDAAAAAALASGAHDDDARATAAAAAAAAAAAVLPWRLRVRVCQEVAAALDFLHCQEIVHRDIKTGALK